MLEHKNWRYTRTWIKLMRREKGQGGKAKPVQVLIATEEQKISNLGSRINGLDQRAHSIAYDLIGHA